MLMWNLTGTERQQAIAREAFNRIKFPFERLTLPGTPELGWRNLNIRKANSEVREHNGEHEEGKERPDPLIGMLEGRHWIMGVIYPMSGRIYLDVRLENYPEVAYSVVSAEIAHAVDFFLPMTDHMRNELLRLWNRPNTTWWEKFDYSAEYYSLGGEAFMHEFTAAYTDLDFGNKSSFIHDAGVEPEDVWRILGIKRTDVALPKPEPKPEPTPEPEPDLSHLKHFPGGKDIYHKRGHYGLSRGVPLTTLEGFRACKVCKPQL